MKTAVVAIVEKDGKILLGKKVSSNHFLSGSWHIPGGKLHEGETEEEALKREMKEEAGIEIRVERFLDEFFVPHSGTTARWYLCSYLKGNLRAGDDLDNVKFVDKNQAASICHPIAIENWPPKVKEYLRPEKSIRRLRISELL